MALRNLVMGEKVAHVEDTSETYDGTVVEEINSGSRYVIKWSGGHTGEYSRYDLIAVDDPRDRNGNLTS